MDTDNLMMTLKQQPALWLSHRSWNLLEFCMCHLWRNWTTEGSMGLDQWYRRNIAMYSTRSLTDNMYTALFLGHCFCFCSTDVHIPITEEGHTTRLIPVSCCTTSNNSWWEQSKCQQQPAVPGPHYCWSLQYQHSLIPRLLSPAVVACSTVWEWDCHDNASDQQ